MKRNRLKTIIAAVLTVALAAATAVPSLAKNGRENAAITYRNIKVYADDELLVPLDPAGKPAEPFIMNGTTYLPLRAVGEAVGYDVHWDPERNVIDLMTAAESLPAYTSTNRDTVSNPMRVGERYIYQNKMDRDIAQIGITMLEVLRGGEVTAKFPDILNLGPQIGNVILISGITRNQEILAARFRVEFLDGTGWYEKGLCYPARSYEFALEAASSPPECKNINVNHVDTFDIMLKPGGSAEGYVFFFIDKNAKDAQILWGHKDVVRFDASGS